MLVYIDDILCYCKTFEDHLRDLEIIFDRLVEANIQLKPSKCRLFQNELVYLGHLVSADGIRPDPKKIEAILKMPGPTDVTTVRSFIGIQLLFILLGSIVITSKISLNFVLRYTN